ncbi:MAG: UbiA family prenyltransferase [Lentisphaeria bacterium]|jgi:4-hydroxybenzoate polyprenyltransferase|nr:UbiA family prenyltransferase [Lentisphaeria bacterium]
MSASRKVAGTDLRAWLQLVRLPNLLSVPGDPWAGLALASLANGQGPAPSAFILSGLASLCLYAAGLILNDLHDEAADRVHRPERPLPSGRVPRLAAARLGTALGTLGVVLALPLGRAAFLTVLLLAALVAAYNLQFKGHRLNASVCMGLCRGFSLLLGAAAGGFGFAPLAAAAGLTVYIGAVTWMAAGENHTQTFERIPLVPARAFAVAGALAALALIRSAPIASWLVGVALVAWTIHRLWLHGRRLVGKPIPPATMQPAVGGYIRQLIPWQAGLLAMAACPLLAVGLLVLAPLARKLARHYAES